MKGTLPRRGFLQGAAAALAVAWSPAARSWTTTPGQGSIQIPSLDGELLTGATTLAQASDDFGHMVHRTPLAVLVPGSVKDIVKMVHFARAHGLKVAGTRGIGESHSTQGQALLQGGVLIDMSALHQIHSIHGHSADVDAGVRWDELLTATTPLGKSPPTITDFIELSVGGTLSVGGIGGQAFRAGLQVDNVIELEVVTGRGHHVTCSPFENPLLFWVVRAGLGQFGIIVRARLRLDDVDPMVRVYTAVYDDLEAFTSDQLTLIGGDRFDYVEGSVASGASGWQFVLEAAKYFDPSAPPDDAALLAGLSCLPGTQAAADSSFFDFANRLAPQVEFLKQVGAWYVPHPWLDLFIPAPDIVPTMQSILAQVTPADMGGGPILLYPINHCHLTAPFLRVPDTAQSFLLSMLRFAVPPTPEVAAAQLAQNRAFFDANTAIGGKRYPIDSIEMSRDDWEDHFDPRWEFFTQAKALFDPDNVLTPGQRIF